ncbi:LysR family transcriptional regulator [Furfurilactobacillus siliginis]|uniref:Transcriptional regulator n=1 Tax=Furfurilactobacillus siliginis TaxID=348151 RepID=A0A0R2LBP9_9LACO|nr:LysR family transcriptional regulator [Furfurilactobacillus siliginis]KRN97110.1 transcriptional regulator [Furfurilactobacillus siliginis]GEK29398.1 LysR family transcriptional regulator [Furfurilactobacillus siliginis]
MATSSFPYLVFATVVEKHTFLAAAEALRITPSAVSHSISQLEDQLGFPLFIRSRTGATLTIDGQSVYPIIQDILNSELRLRQEAANINGLTQGNINIGAFSSVLLNWLPAIIREFHASYPDVNVSVYQGSFNDIAERVRLGTLDVGFSALPITENVQLHPLIKDEVFCITPRDFTPKNGHVITNADVANHTFILQQSDYDRDTKLTLDRYDVTPNSLYYSIDDASIISMVEAGLGFGVLPNLALKRITGNVNIYPFDEPHYRTLCVVANNSLATAPTTTRMLSVIRQNLSKQYGKQLLWQ